MPLNFDLLQKNPTVETFDGEFPHFVIEDPLNDELLYNVLNRTFPDPNTEGLSENTAAQTQCLKVLADKTISPVWRALFRECVSHTFFKKMMSLFGSHFKRMYGDKSYVNLLAKEPAIRITTEMHELCTDCQFVINTPANGGSTVRVPHVDNPHEIYALLWYFRHPKDTGSGGDLNLYRVKQSEQQAGASPRIETVLKYYGHHDVNPNDVEVVKTVRYFHNVLVGFLNTPKSVHGVSVRDRSPHPRRYINIIAEQKKELFRA